MDAINVPDTQFKLELPTNGKRVFHVSLVIIYLTVLAHVHFCINTKIHIINV